MDSEYEVFGMDDFAEEIWNDIVEADRNDRAYQERWRDASDHYTDEDEGEDTMYEDYTYSRVRELEDMYIQEMEVTKPNGYKGRAMYMARLHHFIELADNALYVYWLSGKDAKMHKFLVFAPTGKGKLSELVFDMVMTEAFSFGQATMGDSNCGAVTRDRFERQWQVEEHIKDRIARLTGQKVDIK